MDKTTRIEDKAAGADRRAVYLTQEEETTLRQLLAKRAGEWPRVALPGSAVGDVHPGRDALLAANPPGERELELTKAVEAAQAVYDAAMAEVFAEAAKDENKGNPMPGFAGSQQVFFLTPESPAFMEVEEASEALLRARIRLQTEQARRNYRIAYERANGGEPDGFTDKVRRLLGA